jgi:allophanate hydrolase
MTASRRDDAVNLSIAEISNAYHERRSSPVDVIRAVFARIAEHDELGIWITLRSQERALEQARALAGRDPASLPLYGLPFAIKDNIDLAGVPTTAGCPAFSYTPAQSAYVVSRLIDAGAIPVGKTNLDQFATGLVGTRSPYGVCRNSFDPEYIAGGSSSGSAVAVALGLVSFALGTDTAGSGRIPAAFNNLIGLKPTCGSWSPRGVVPACRTLDSLSLFTLNAEDAARICSVAAAFDAVEPYSRRAGSVRRLAPFAHGSFRFGVPRAQQLQFFGNRDYAQLFERSMAHLERLGGQAVEIDFEPFLETARLLYEGPWIAERYLAVERLLHGDPGALHPITRRIIEAGAVPSAAQAFRAQYRLQSLRRVTELVWEDIDTLLTPTAGTIYRIAEVEADPVRLNSQLGLYTNFMNLLDLAAVAVPAGFTAAGLPFGVTLAGPAWSDYELLRLAARLQRSEPARLGALPSLLGPAPNFDWQSLTQGVAVAVCGAHLSGLPLNHQLTQRGALLQAATTTAPNYRLYALPGGPPLRPGLVRVAEHGTAIEVEVWSVPSAAFGSFVAAIPAPLAIGKLTLADGREVSGFLCEAHALAHAQDISAFGGWRNYLAMRQ